MNKDPRNIIIHPMITEKGTRIQEEAGGYLFKVRVDANKIEIRKAIQEIFNVHVKKVNTINYKGKPKNLGRYQGKRADWKKAIVYLVKGESISDFEVLQ